MPPSVKDGKLDLDAHAELAASARPGPWQWFGNTAMHEIYLATVYGGRHIVMDFARWGMRGAQPRFQLPPGVMITLGELGIAENPLGPRFAVPYRRQFDGIGHPDATHIAANDPTTVLALLDRIRELGAALRFATDELEQGGCTHLTSRNRDILAKGIPL